MKIAMIGQKGIPATFGGVERHVEEISVRLAKNKGYQVFVYARYYYTAKKNRQYKKVQIIHQRSIKTKHLDTISNTLFSTLHAIIKLKPDVIHYHGIGPALCLWIPKILSPRTKVIFTFHCRDYFHQKWGRIAQWSLKLGEIIGCHFADQILVVSDELKKYVREKYHINSTLVPHGANIEKYLAPKIIKKWGLKKDNYVLVVSRLIPHKGVHYVLKAFQNLATDKKLVIAGAGFYTDNYEKKLKAIAGQDSQYLFLGNQKAPALKELYSNAFLLIHASEQEGLPLVVLEAASFGKAMLLSDIVEHKSMFNQLPFFFESKNIADLRYQLKAILKKSYLVKQKGQKIKQYSLKHYSWDKTVKNIIACYWQF